MLHESNSRMDFVHEDGEIWYVPSPSEWSSKLGLENLRLFFLIMAKILGECDYEFNNYEFGKLKMVKLESLKNECILKYSI